MKKILNSVVENSHDSVENIEALAINFLILI